MFGSVYRFQIKKKTKIDEREIGFLCEETILSFLNR